MKKINYIIVGMSMLLTFCESPKKAENKDVADNELVRDEKLATTDDQQVEEVQSVEKEKTYQSISNPDTAMAYFLYETYQEFKPAEYQEEYQRLDLEYDRLLSLVKSIFSDKTDLENALEGIKSLRKKFIGSIRDRVYKDYKKYHGVSGMSFDFLLNRKDSLVQPLLYELVKDDKAPQSEKEYAARILFEYYQDSTFIKN